MIVTAEEDFQDIAFQEKHHGKYIMKYNTKDGIILLSRDGKRIDIPYEVMWKFAKALGI